MPKPKLPEMGPIPSDLDFDETNPDAPELPGEERPCLACNVTGKNKAGGWCRVCGGHGSTYVYDDEREEDVFDSRRFKPRPRS